jgi:hypothetical protein
MGAAFHPIHRSNPLQGTAPWGSPRTTEGTPQNPPRVPPEPPRVPPMTTEGTPPSLAPIAAASRCQRGGEALAAVGIHIGMS